jgi:hypothetical protein
LQAVPHHGFGDKRQALVEHGQGLDAGSAFHVGAEGGEQEAGLARKPPLALAQPGDRLCKRQLGAAAPQLSQQLVCHSHRGFQPPSLLQPGKDRGRVRRGERRTAPGRSSAEQPQVREREPSAGSRLPAGGGGGEQLERPRIVARLELLRSLLQSCLGEKTYNSLIQAGAQGGAHVEKPPVVDPNLEAWVAEMEEVIAAWPKIEPTVRAGLLAIVRSQRESVVRVSR